MVDIAGNERSLLAIKGTLSDPYQSAVEEVYSGDPRDWEAVLGAPIWFQGGVYDAPRPEALSIAESGERHFDLQLRLAGYRSGGSDSTKRILDIGCGWGAELEHLFNYFPNCPEIDAVNISSVQLEYCAERLDRLGMRDRVNLYLCNAQDIALLPGLERPYDLVVMRGSSTHFSMNVLQATLDGTARRMSQGSSMVIAENLYRDGYESPIPDTTDRLACRYRKTPAEFLAALKQNMLVVDDIRKLPSNADMIQWWHDIGLSVRERFGAAPPPVFQDVQDAAANMELALAKDAISAYSIIAHRVAGP
jgi:cyclopropane fatty-acyl-phospholipid synthase-like methyltransferase